MKAALKAADGRGVRILKDKAFGHLLGDPRVIIERRNGASFVRLDPRPWGWPSLDAEFIGGSGKGAEKYAQQLLDRIHAAGKNEHERRERLKALRQQEREASR